jgi:DNA polymerase-3 subunit alpha (Gram-positive type)
MLEHIEMPADARAQYFADSAIERVDVSRAAHTWKIMIAQPLIVPWDVYQLFAHRLQVKYAHIAETHLHLCYGERVSRAEVVHAYWAAFVHDTQASQPGINGWLTKAQVAVEEDLITVSLLDQVGVDMARKKKIDELVKTFFLRHGALTYRVKMVLATQEQAEAEREQFALEQAEAEKSYVVHMMEEAAQEAASAAARADYMDQSSGSSYGGGGSPWGGGQNGGYHGGRGDGSGGGRSRKRVQDDPANGFCFGYEIKDEPVPIIEVQEAAKRLTIQGMVFGLDIRELKSGKLLIMFNLTDYTDSLSIKVFPRSKEDEEILQKISDGQWLKVRGKVDLDTFMSTPELVMMLSDFAEVSAPPDVMDEAPEKRVEWHLHTQMSTMDAVPAIGEYVQRAALWGHKAIAVTDHSNIQCYPDAAKAAKKYGVQMLYGLEANVVNDAVPIVRNPRDQDLATSTYVMFDLETTGLSVTAGKLIEIAAVRMRAGEELDHFTTLIDPGEKLSYTTTKITNITDEMVTGAPQIEPKLREFVAFVGDDVLVAHNAGFDIGFIQANLRRIGEPELTNPVLDTVELARLLHPNLKNHKLNTLAARYQVSLENHHRALDDTLALGGIFFALIKDGQEMRQMTNLAHLNDFVGQDLKRQRPFHCGIYALNQTGKKHLFQLISLSHTEYFHKVPTIPKSVLAAMREGLLIVSGCEKGEMFETALNKSFDEALDVAAFYDVLEIQPLDFYMHLLDRGLVNSRAELEQTLRRIVKLGEETGKPVIATGNVHYLLPRDKMLRDITINGITGFSPLKDQRKPDAHFRTTQEMLDAFAFLGEDKAYEVVVTNTVELVDQFEPFDLFPQHGGPGDNGLFSPLIDGAEEEIRTTCYATAEACYGTPLPDVVVQRLEKELVPIIKYGFSANYLISQKLVKKSNADGYLVGSRGSVGSSLVATFLGITEVNPLAPHYLCTNPDCKHSEWFLDGSIGSGFDLPAKDCPQCGAPLKGDGQDIPFETFLGFKGDKVPDIDLNFSGDYQAQAHDYTKVLFGEKNVFRAGTIGTVAEKTGYGYALKYQEEKGKDWRGAELSRIAAGVTGVKRSTGQHPGGIVVVPDYIDVEDVTPVQYPADDTSGPWRTTHFDYHAFESNLLKLDILGHDDPTMMHMLYELTGVDPLTIPMNDPRVMSLFSSTTELGVTPAQLRSPVATYGIPEMGTKFVRQILEETLPSTFADLLQISGLSHGTGVWRGNAQDLIKSGTCTIKTVIGCRDDIMLFLIYKHGMEAGLAFKITESVRKGRGVTDEWIAAMREAEVPEWYIDSCLRIKYMFPRAHAAAYVISAVRTAYYKLYYPIEYYATYFSVRAEEFDLDILCQGYDAILKELLRIEEKGFTATMKEKSSVSFIEMALEMTARGFSFLPLDLTHSQAQRFVVAENGTAIIPPFAALPGIGEAAARNIAAACQEMHGNFLSIEDFATRSKASKNIVELLRGIGVFGDLTESNQLMLF